MAANLAGFPGDDEFSMQQGDPYGGEANLDIYYAHQFIQNEVSRTSFGESQISSFPIENDRIVRNSMTDEIYRDGELIQIFVADTTGRIIFTNIRPNLEVMAVSGFLSHRNSRVILNWNEIPGPNHIKTSYEFHIHEDSYIQESSIWSGDWCDMIEDVNWQTEGF